MLYKLIINYVRLQLLQLILKQVKHSKFAKTKHIKARNILIYGLEFLATFYINRKLKKHP